MELKDKLILALTFLNIWVFFIIYIFHENFENHSYLIIREPSIFPRKGMGLQLIAKIQAHYVVVREWVRKLNSPNRKQTLYNAVHSEKNKGWAFGIVVKQQTKFSILFTCKNIGDATTHYLSPNFMFRTSAQDTCIMYRSAWVGVQLSSSYSFLLMPTYHGKQQVMTQVSPSRLCGRPGLS